MLEKFQIFIYIVKKPIGVEKCLVTQHDSYNKCKVLFSTIQDIEFKC